MVMRQPALVTKSGLSYDRDEITQVARHSSRDPLTRVMFTEDDIVPNIALKQAIETFFSHNGDSHDAGDAGDPEAAAAREQELLAQLAQAQAEAERQSAYAIELEEACQRNM